MMIQNFKRQINYGDLAKKGFSLTTCLFTPSFDCDTAGYRRLYISLRFLVLVRQVYGEVFLRLIVSTTIGALETLFIRLSLRLALHLLLC